MDAMQRAYAGRRLSALADQLVREARETFDGPAAVLAFEYAAQLARQWAALETDTTSSCVGIDTPEEP